MTITILGKRWNVRFVPTLGAGEHLGDCTPPHETGKTIRVLSTLRGRKLLDVMLHEMLHAADWHKDEEWVERVAEDLARALFRPELRDYIWPEQGS